MASYGKIVGHFLRYAVTMAVHTAMAVTYAQTHGRTDGAYFIDPFDFQPRTNLIKITNFKNSIVSGTNSVLVLTYFEL